MRSPAASSEPEPILYSRPPDPPEVFPETEIKRAGAFVARAPRAVLSIRPSEAKAVVKIGEATHKVVYHTKDGQPMIGIAGSPSVSLETWLRGEAELTGLPGA